MPDESIAPAAPSQRLTSVDALRGFDMFWIMGPEMGHALVLSFAALVLGGKQNIPLVKTTTSTISGGHGSRTRNRFPGTTFPVWPLAIRLPSGHANLIARISRSFKLRMSCSATRSTAVGPSPLPG